MKQINDARGQRWELQLLNIGQRVLVGGIATVAFGVGPVGDAADGRSTSTREACKMLGKNYTCHVVGPAALYVAAKGQEITEELLAGEKATLDNPGTRLRCRTGIHPHE